MERLTTSILLGREVESAEEGCHLKRIQHKHKMMQRAFISVFFSLCHRNGCAIPLPSSGGFRMQKWCIPEDSGACRLRCILGFILPLSCRCICCHYSVCTTLCPPGHLPHLWKPGTVSFASSFVSLCPPGQSNGLTVMEAHKKGSGSTKNGRDSNSQRRGVKVYGDQAVKAGGALAITCPVWWLPFCRHHHSPAWYSVASRPECWHGLGFHHLLQEGGRCEVWEDSGAKVNQRLWCAPQARTKCAPACPNADSVATSQKVCHIRLHWITIRVAIDLNHLLYLYVVFAFVLEKAAFLSI